MAGILFNQIFDRTIRGVEKQLDLTWRRNEAITSNIANAETPQYRAKDLNFSSELERAFATMSGKSNEMMKTDSRHLDLHSNSGAHLIADYSGATRADGNNVDIDIQMGKLAYNGGQYSMAATLIKRKLGFLTTAIRLGGQ